MNWSLILQNTVSAFFGVDAMYFAIAAIGLNVQFGYTGLLNFGQAGFMAAGAYALGQTALWFHISLWWGIPIALAYAVVFGLIMGIPTLRLRADYLAIVTIGMAEVIRLVVRSVTFKKKFGGSDGINNFGQKYRNLTPYSEGEYRLWPFAYDDARRWLLLTAMVVIGGLVGALLAATYRRGTDRTGKWNDPFSLGAAAVGAAVLVLLSSKVKYFGYSLWSITVGWVVVAALACFVYLLMRSPWGRVLRGIREDEDAVRSLGKNVYSYKMQSLILGGAIATFAGMMFSLDRGSVQPDNYSRDVTFYVLTALVLGGAAKISGSIIGPMLFWALLSFTDSFLNGLFKEWGGHIDIFGFRLIRDSSDIGVFRYMLAGLLLVALMAFRPQGLFGNRKEMALDGR